MATDAAVITATPEVGSPQWWLLRLLRRLEDRQPTLLLWDDYYRGAQPLAFASDKFREAFGERFPAFTSNFAQVVVDGVAERLEVQGFHFATKEQDDEVWRIWQENELDAGSQQAQQEALIKGRSFALVEPQPNGATPVITIEDARDAVVECDPRSGRVRRAALKRWVQDDGTLAVYLYMPDFIYKYETGKVWGNDYSRWWGAPLPWDTGYEWRVWHAAEFRPLQVPGEEWPLPNRLGVVPMIELANRPRLKAGPRSEVASIRSNQDAINKYRCDALIASEFAAFPQRYLLNFEPERDPDTGRAKEPFRAAIDRLWTIPPPDPDNPDAPEPKVGQFAAASLEPYVRMIELEVGHISAISQLPDYTLLGSPSSIPASAESIKSSEAGLLRKVGLIELFMGQGWEELMRVAALAASSNAAEVRAAETVWADPETRNEAVRTDAIVKLHAEGIIDDELSWELAGLSRLQIEALRRRRTAAAEAAAGAPAAPPPGGAPGGAPSTVPAPTGPRMSPVAPGG